MVKKYKLRSLSSMHVPIYASCLKKNLAAAGHPLPGGTHEGIHSLKLPGWDVPTPVLGVD